MEKMINEDIKVLIVEDDEIARENAVEYLQDYFSNIFEASNALDALKIYETKKPDIIISDIQMPRLNGLEFIKRVRQKDKKVQIIVLTAFCDKEYLLKAIELQLVKYLIKPINEYEFDMAIKNSIEALKNDETNIIKLQDGLVFDMFNLVLLKDGELIKLRIKEVDFIKLLLKNRGRYVTYQEIENFVWDEQVMTKDALKTLVKNLKKKVSKDFILNLSGIGYKLAF
ncbi:response regulator transcription factor [Halarcobacter ebronensis]|uniref:DNA-binding response regulator n=1 Tax=Halarcobacter ebronensis TaxID=1462615 RepID=A0A4Q1ADD5_9BACT|nr:response regulator [Halarcobacter ebronensis]RXK01393.1 DNA-binding response regulator [Halarcobacter ebronensis]